MPTRPRCARRWRSWAARPRAAGSRCWARCANWAATDPAITPRWPGRCARRAWNALLVGRSEMAPLAARNWGNQVPDAWQTGAVRPLRECWRSCRCLAGIRAGAGRCGPHQGIERGRAGSLVAALGNRKGRGLSPQMLYLIAQTARISGLANLFRYQSFRSGAALIDGLVIGLLIGPRFIGWLRVRQGKGQPIREDGPQTHLAKRGTPTMGGLMILTALVMSVLLWMDLTNPFVWACLFVTLGFGAIGFLDDYDKVTKRSHEGLSGKVRLLLEFVIAGIAAWIIVHQLNTNLYVPFITGPVYSAGAVLFRLRRLRDRGVRQCGEPDRRARRPGDDAGDHRGGHVHDHRLSGRPRRLCALSGHSACAGRGRTGDLLRRDHRGGAGLPVVQRAAGGGVHGRYRQPGAGRRARRDRGHRASRNRAGIVGGLFVLEAMSVIIQVFFYKRTGRRVFRMAPIHHHFEQLGWASRPSSSASGSSRSCWRWSVCRR